MTYEEIEDKIRDFIDREIWPKSDTADIAEALGLLFDTFDMLAADEQE